MKKRLFSVGLLVAAVLALSSCGLFSKKSERRVRVQKRDVPHKARKSLAAEPRQRILVLPVIDMTQTPSEKLKKVSRAVLVENLLRTDRFVVIRNSDFPKDVLSYLLNNEYDLKKMSQTASGLGISALLEGKILDIKARRVGDEVGLIRKLKARMEATIQVRLVATETGREIINETRTAIIEDTTTQVGKYSSSDRYLKEDPKLIRLAVVKAFRSIVPPIIKSVRKLSWTGRIAHISGDQIFLNAGRLSGIQVGDLLKVVDDGDDIFDPETGDFIGHAPGRMKGTVEVIRYFGKDGAIAVVHSGAGFKPKDKVEMY